jgi:hypothetical protein
MTPDIDDPTFCAITGAVGMSILEQLRPEKYEGLNAKRLFEDDTLMESFLEDMRRLKVRPEIVTSSVISSLLRLLFSPENSPDMVEAMAAVLWKTLGNPEDGDKPPAIYSRAAASMQLVFAYFLCPDYLKHISLHTYRRGN